MKLTYLILALILCTGCSSNKKVVKTDGSKFSRIIFKKQLVVTERGIDNFNKKVASLLPKVQMDSLVPKAEYDSITHSPKFKKMMSDFHRKSLMESPPSETVIEIINDSIWRHERQNGKIIGDYYLIKKEDAFLYYYNKSRSINYKKYDLLEAKDNYKIIRNESDRKFIKGFNCFRMTLIKEIKTLGLGNTIYDMYVTKEIDLPAHSVLNLSKLIPGYFPLEIKIRSEKLPGLVEDYVLTKIE
ncbi:MAG: hypothetical protein V3V16_13980 [Melioribacteraceae bacterium]